MTCSAPNASFVIPIQRRFVAHPLGEFVKVGVEVGGQQTDVITSWMAGGPTTATKRDREVKFWIESEVWLAIAHR